VAAVFLGLGEIVVLVASQAAASLEQHFAAIDALANGRLSHEGWLAECEGLGIAGRALGKAAPVFVPKHDARQPLPA